MVATAPQTLLTLRVDVQNVGSVPLPPMTLKVEPPSNMDAFHNTLQTALANAMAAADGEEPEKDAATRAQSPFEIDVEIYDARNDQFVRLQSVSQLTSKRSRLNVILRRTDGAQQNHLALPSKLFDSTVFSIRDHVVSVGEIGNSGKGTGLTTWDGSIVLAKYLEHTRAADIKGARILEVGAGTGLVGLSAALLGAKHVILTDLEYTMENLQRNAAETMANAHRTDDGDDDTTDAGTAAVGEVTTQVLDWFDPPTTMGSLDFVLASDVVWVEELIPPLVQTFDVLLRSSQAPTTVLMSYQKRSIVSDQLLFSELEKHHLVKRKIPSSALHPEFTSERIDVWEITRASGAAKEEL
uniref:FAM86 N-terminal domain-containing protein n=1 Tax=Globisporangium ultimum (strain ATCC 200006 / CBS 805.95 / DAOM BR144) TaxID=431595 RepID=K3X793_GLOUD